MPPIAIPAFSRINSDAMLLTDAPNLPLVIGLPVALMIGAAAIGVATFVVLSRLTRGSRSS
ncbi:MAG: hypothetical protein JOY68_07400 [Candidatus Dormibacteraeota bacterium]|nr:hypothetical protein [Candidatus Dormibacteraeota bacterium]MBV8445102.1 hypothetical protein [Candidatus Dormibacteraeota bacterium]